VEIGRLWWPGQMAEGDRSYRLQRRLTDQLMREIETLVRQAESRVEP
jgi:hypothetical protein